MALYIDLNPLRAGLVDDAKNYRWTGYSEACGGSKLARRGLCRVMEAPLDSWEERRGGSTQEEVYGCWLFGEGLEAETEGPAGRPVVPASARKKGGFPKKKVEAVLKSGGKLSRGELLLCRVRWFSDGMAIGGRGFVDGVFAACRDHFGAKRKTGAR